MLVSAETARHHRHRMPARARIILSASLVALMVMLLWARKGGPLPVVENPMETAGLKVEGKSSGSEDLDPLYEEIFSVAREGETPLPFKTKARVRLRPGELAVIGFWQISRDSNGLAMITPAILPDGNVAFSTRLLKVSDAAATDPAIRDLFPAPFDVEQSGAMQKEAVQSALRHLLSSNGVDVMSMPVVVTRPGLHAKLTVGEMEAGTDSSDSGLQRGYELDLHAATPSADGTFDLDIGLDVK